MIMYLLDVYSSKRSTSNESRRRVIHPEIMDKSSLLSQPYIEKFTL